MTKTIRIITLNGAMIEFQVNVPENWDFGTQCLRWRADGYLGTEKIHIPYSSVAAVMVGDAELTVKPPGQTMQ